MFTVFDIQEFYPSTNEKLLNKAVLVAQTYTDINQNDMEKEVIFHCRRPLLFHDNEPCIERNSNRDSDVTMESYNGAEVCELAGLFMLNELSKKFDKDNIELYRDDGLSVSYYHNGHQNDKVWRKMIYIFKRHHLSLGIKSNLNLDYLNITFDLTKGLFKRYNKTNSIPRYVNGKSDHPLSILKEVLKSLSKCISSNSCSKHVLNAAEPFYNYLLDKCAIIIHCR